MSVDPGERGISIPNSAVSGLRRMDEPIADKSFVGDQGDRSSDFPRDNIVQDLAKPNPALLGEVQTVQERDPFSFTKEEFGTLHPAMQDRVLLSLMRDGEKEINKTQIEELRPDFEMQSPLNDKEINTFRFFDRYFRRGKLIGFDEDKFEAMSDEDIDHLDLEKHRREKGERRFPRQNILGFNLARFDRYLIEEQIRKEREGVERGQINKPDAQPVVSELPKAA